MYPRRQFTEVHMINEEPHKISERKCSSLSGLFLILGDCPTHWPFDSFCEPVNSKRDWEALRLEYPLAWLIEHSHSGPNAKSCGLGIWNQVFQISSEKPELLSKLAFTLSTVSSIVVFCARLSPVGKLWELPPQVRKTGVSSLRISLVPRCQEVQPFQNLGGYVCMIIVMIFIGLCLQDYVVPENLSHWEFEGCLN